MGGALVAQVAVVVTAVSDVKPLILKLVMDGAPSLTNLVPLFGSCTLLPLLLRLAPFTSLCDILPPRRVRLGRSHVRIWDTIIELKLEGGGGEGGYGDLQM